MDVKLISTVSGAGQSVSPNRLLETQSQPQSLANAPEKQAVVELSTKGSEKPDTETAARSRDQIGELVEELNSRAQSNNRTLKFSVDEKLGRAIISVVDSETEEVIRQIPPETALQIAEAFEDTGAGKLLSEQV